MCQVKVRSCGSSGGGALAGLALMVGAGALVVSVIGSVLASVAALLSTAVWALAVVGGMGVLAAAGVAVTREVLWYRADRREDLLVLAQLAARGIPAPPAGVGARPPRAAIPAAGYPALAGDRAGAR
jgi:hypothetical protein